MRRKPSGEPLTFGDVVEADWLFDVYLREGAEALIAETDHSNNILRYKPEARTRERVAGRDYTVGFATSDGVFSPQGDEHGSTGSVLAFGNRRRAVILTDECETSKVLEKGGRLLLAVLVPYPRSEAEQRMLRPGQSSWRRFALPPAGEWEGAVVDFSKHVAVWHESMQHATPTWSLSEEEAGALRVGWATYATRHGPIAATDGVSKLIEMFHIGDDASQWAIDRRSLQLTPDEDAAREKFNDLFDRFWNLEGGVVDTIADAHEARGVGRNEAAALLLQEMGLLRAELDAAEAALLLVMAARRAGDPTSA